MVEFDFVGVVLAAIVAGVVSFSLIILNKVSQVNELSLTTRTELKHMEPRLDAIEERIDKICERFEELSAKQRLDSYKIDEMKKKQD